jgi:hypothetical protein
MVQETQHEASEEQEAPEQQVVVEEQERSLSEDGDEEVAQQGEITRISRLTTFS